MREGKNKKTIWIIGAGGIGVAIAKAYQQRGHVVTLISRRLLVEKEMKTIQLSQDPLGIKQFIETHPLPDEIIITSGILHDSEHQPEKSITRMNRDWFIQSMDQNVVPSIIWLKYLTKIMNHLDRLKIVCFSARVSSLSDNRLGGWHSYRMSKAALNMLVKNVAIEWKIKSPQACIIAYHPGTVDTGLSKPFQKNVPHDALFSPAIAAEHFINVFETKSHQDSGKLFDWQNKAIAY